MLALWMILVCSFSVYGSVQTNNTDGVYPLRYNNPLSFTSPLLIPLRITSGFGQRFHPVTAHYADHHGTDFAAPTFSKVVAIESGMIIKIGSDSISGRYLVVQHKNGWLSKYLHLSVFNVQLHQFVGKGNIIALSGASGRTTGPHLHLEISYRGHMLDPALIFSSQYPSRAVFPILAVKKSNLKKMPEGDPGPRIVFVVQRNGKPKVAVRKDKTVVYADEGSKVFNKFKVVKNGKRFSLQKLGS